MNKDLKKLMTQKITRAILEFFRIKNNSCEHSFKKRYLKHILNKIIFHLPILRSFKYFDSIITTTSFHKFFFILNTFFFKVYINHGNNAPPCLTEACYLILEGGGSCRAPPDGGFPWPSSSSLD